MSDESAQEVIKILKRLEYGLAFLLLLTMGILNYISKFADRL